MKNLRAIKRYYRHQRIRKQVKGTAEQPRLFIYRSLNNLYAQLVDDVTGKVLYGRSTLAKELKGQVKSGGNVEAATKLGEFVGAEIVKKGFKKVCFDRGGNLYHGRVKAFADGARKGGLEF